MDPSDVKYPWASAVNAANFVTVKPCLKEDKRLTNFNIWKEQMLCLVESQGLLGFINGEIMPPEKANNISDEESSKISENVEYEQTLWKRTDRLVKGWILGSIGKDALDAVWKLQTAREVWLELEKTFNCKAAAAKEDKFESSRPGEDGSSGDLSMYLPLYKAALRGDWKKAKELFDKDKEATTAIISSNSETALHVAVSTGRGNEFVKKLVKKMPADALGLKGPSGNTALHVAAMVGNTEAATLLLSKKPDLLYVLGIKDRLPVQVAAVNGHKDMLEYLIPKYEQNVEPSPFEGQLGFRLLLGIICSELFDVALDLVQKYPDLGRLRNEGTSALETMAAMDTVFLCGENFSWWQKLIFHRIPLKQSKREAAQVISVAGDIENANCDASAYKKHSSLFQIFSGVVQQLESMIWKVLANLVPQVKGIGDKKAKRQQAIELVKFLCQQMDSWPANEASKMYRNSIITAARHGISEIVELIIEMYPMVTFARDIDGRNVFHLAARHRFENVFNLIYNISDRRYQIFNSLDNDNNNLMHICAKIAPPKRLNLVPGAALQMQRELQWFKEMENFVHPSRRPWNNRQNRSPKVLFTEEHRQLKVEGEKWMKDTANACTIAAALIATVVFAAAFTLPGGTAENGNPIFSDQFPFVLFAISDAVSLFTSITSLLMFLSILTSRYAEEDFLYILPNRLSIGLFSLFISVIFMMAAFSATMYLALHRRLAWFLIPVAAFACLPVTSFVLLQFPLLIDVVYSTYGPGIFGKKSDRELY